MLSREERRRPLALKHAEMDYTLCTNANCNKMQCARNIKNRVAFGSGKDLRQETVIGSCDNYLPKSRLMSDKKRIFKLIK